MALTITICIAVLCCLACAFVSRQYVKRAYSEIDGVLDNVLAKKADFSFDREADSRLSKLVHKAAKITQMNAADIAELGQEKQTIQGFISDMSHQMKTPLSGVAMYTDLLLEESLSEDEQQEFLLRIKSGTDKLQWMMDSLVKMSRLEVGAIELSPVPAGIRQTISESVGMVLAAATKRNISIRAEAFPDTLLLHDRKWTMEAMTNILENAVKYSEEEGEIHICLEQLPLYTKISFTDFGVGIPLEEWNLIFKRFYRGQNAKETEGAGLGLYLANLILEKQGGYLLVDSKIDEYTTFSMFLQNCKK